MGTILGDSATNSVCYMWVVYRRGVADVGSVRSLLHVAGDPARRATGGSLPAAWRAPVRGQRRGYCERLLPANGLRAFVADRPADGRVAKDLERIVFGQDLPAQ